MSKRIWCGVYAVSLLAVILTMLVSGILAMAVGDEILLPQQMAIPAALSVLGYLQFVLVHTITTLVLLFKSWKALEDGVTPVTAGKAVGFLFIPFFNIYWFFRVWGGYPSEYNKFVGRNRLAAPKLASGLHIGFAVTVGLTAILVLPILILPFVTIILLSRTIDAINNLELAKVAVAQGRIASTSEFVGTAENPRSKVPILASVGALAVLAVIVIGLGLMSWFNMNPAVPSDALAEKVGDFKLERAGNVTGSFFGGQFRSMDNIYVSDAGGDRRAIRYNIFEFRSPETARKRIESTCDKNATISELKDKQGAPAGRLCEEGNAILLQIGRYYVWTHQAGGYDLEKAKAKEASRSSLNSFVRALPFSSQLVFPESPYR